MSSQILTNDDPHVVQYKEDMVEKLQQIFASLAELSLETQDAKKAEYNAEIHGYLKEAEEIANTYREVWQ